MTDKEKSPPTIKELLDQQLAIDRNIKNQKAKPPAQIKAETPETPEKAEKAEKAETPAQINSTKRKYKPRKMTDGG